jgi:hypothetical protein
MLDRFLCFNFKFLSQLTFHRFLNLPQLPKALAKKVLKKGNNDLYWQFQKYSDTLVQCRSDVELYYRFAFTYVLENVALLYGDFGMNSYSVDSDEPMKK